MSDSQPVVFLVDDDPSVRKSVSRLIQSAGYAVESFSNPQEYLNRKPFQGNGCVVLDVKMPSMSGLELQEMLLKSGASLPIIFITGFGDVPSSVRALKKGAVDFLQKPFREEELLEAIQEALQKDAEQKRHNAEIAGIKKRYETLTAREKEVYGHIISGKLNKQIAGDM